MKTFNREQAIGYFETKLAFSAGPSEVNHMMKEEREAVNVVDVRRAEDYRKGHIPGAVSLPEEQWDTLVGLDKKRTNVIYCYTQQCHVATRACLKFARRGFPVVELEGGWKAWQEYGLEVEQEESVRFDQLDQIWPQLAFSVVLPARHVRQMHAAERAAR